MEFWSNRYTTPGWIFLGSLIAFSIILGVINIQVTLSIGSGIVGIAALALGIMGGLPLGFCIENIYFVFDRLFRLGANRYINHEYFHTELLKIISDVIAKEEDSREKHILERYVYGLRACETKDVRRIRESYEKEFPRAIYTLFWHTLAPQDIRSFCNRRWETYHMAGGSVCGICLAGILAIALFLILKPALAVDIRSVLVISLASILCVVSLIVNAKSVANQASERENAWIELFLSRLRNDPDEIINLFDKAFFFRGK